MIEKKEIILLLLVYISFYGCTPELDGDDSISNTSRNWSMSALVKNQDTIWDIAFLPDGTMLFTERPGRLNMLKDGEPRTIANLDTTEISEAGLLGIAVDPSFRQNNHIYLYYTFQKDEPVNRVSRFTLRNDALSDEAVLIDDIPSARFHNGGRIRFGPDGKLYITTGDATDPSSAQDIGSLAGKILRMNKDGTIPNDNPFGNYIYSYGHRNPQGLAWNDGVMYASEHGPNRHDEINIIEKGANYGWPDTCDDQSDDTVQPIRCYTDFTLAPGGISFHDDNLYVAALRGAQLRRLIIVDEEVRAEEIVVDDLGRIRVVVENDGLLYIGTSNRDGRGIPNPDDDKILEVK